MASHGSESVKGEQRGGGGSFIFEGVGDNVP